MNLQRTLATGAVTLMLAGTAGGLAHGLSIRHETLLGLREHHLPAFEQAARGDMDAARLHLQQATGKNFRYVRIIDAHTHVTKLASLAMLLAFLLPVLPLGGTLRRGVAGAFLAGTVLFPGAVLMQVWIPGLLFQAMAALGAGLVIAAMSVTVVGVFRYGRDKPGPTGGKSCG